LHTESESRRDGRAVARKESEAAYLISDFGFRISDFGFRNFFTAEQQIIDFGFRKADFGSILIAEQQLSH
jgi:hypothetical protein